MLWWRWGFPTKSHSKLTDSQKGALMLHCRFSSKDAPQQPTESQLTARPTLTALQGHEAKGSFCPMPNNTSGICHGIWMSSCWQKGRADWCQSPSVYYINTPSLKTINWHTVQADQKGQTTPKSEKTHLQQTISRIPISNFSNSCFSLFFEHNSYFRYQLCDHSQENSSKVVSNEVNLKLVRRQHLLPLLCWSTGAGFKLTAHF